MTGLGPGDRTIAVVRRRAAAGDITRCAWSTAGPGAQRAPNPVVSRVCGTWKPRHGPAPAGAGRPIARGAEYQAGKDGREANAGGRKAAGNQASMPSPSRAGPA